MTVTVSDRERKCLKILVEYSDSDASCLYFRTIARRTGLGRIQVKRSVRSLARKGLAEYIRGLFDDEGMVAGSGYCATQTGREFMNGNS
jgi:predicted transcriptional regulator